MSKGHTRISRTGSSSRLKVGGGPRSANWTCTKCEPHFEETVGLSRLAVPAGSGPAPDRDYPVQPAARAEDRHLAVARRDADDSPLDAIVRQGDPLDVAGQPRQGQFGRLDEGVDGSPSLWARGDSNSTQCKRVKVQATACMKA